MCIRDSGSVTVLAAKGGVEPQAETVWRQADEYKVPRMVYVNKMDTMGADFFRCIKMLHDRLHANGVAIQLPIGQEDTFRGIVDLVDMNAEVYYDDMGNDMRTEPIPEDMVEQAEEYRNCLLYTSAAVVRRPWPSVWPPRSWMLPTTLVTVSYTHLPPPYPDT